MDIKRKITSRKFWLCVAAFLASIGASIAGIQTSDTVITTIGTVCAIISAAIYAAAEASVDKAAIAKEAKTASNSFTIGTIPVNYSSPTDDNSTEKK